MKKMSGKSLDLLEKNIDIIQKTFPEVMTEEEFNGKVERKIDFDKLRLLLGDDVSDREERYELRWNGKNDAIRFAQTPSNGTLRPDKESSKNWDDTENLYIEGDNLEVLKLLQKSYFGQIKMIYIDPPYNTGKDFVYKDDFRDNVKNYLEQTAQNTTSNTENSGRYHTNWMNMMYPRLKVARNLLSEEGIIFISIDDNEVTNLKKICDEIFGEDNFAAEIIWEKVYSPRMDAVGFSNSHDYILCYVKKNLSEIKREVFKQNDKQFNYIDKDTGLKYRRRSIRKEGSNSLRSDAPNSYFPIEAPDGELVFPIKPDGTEGCWRWSIETYNENLKNGNVEWVKTSNGWQVYAKQYYNNDATKPPETLWFHKEVNHNHGAAEDLRKILKAKVFETPKPKELIIKTLKIATNKDDIVLDFFSGSATTAHAVMQLNAEDGGNRKFIMVQLPEITPEKSEARKAGYENICEIGKERIRRAGDMIVNENKDKEGIEDLDIGFKVFKLDSSNIKEWDPDYENLEYSLFERQDIIKMGRTNEDLLYEIIIKMGIEPTVGIEEIKFGEKIIYNIGMGALLICLEDEITEDLVAEIPNHKSIIDEMDTKVVFKESGFRTDSAKMNAIQKLKQFGITDVRSV